VEQTTSCEVTKAEENLLKLIRKMGFGELHIVVRDSKPVRAEEIRKSVILDK